MSPWWILLIVVTFVASNAGSFFYGEHVRGAEDKAAEVDAVHQAILDYDAVAEADKAQAVAQAKKRTAAAAEASTIKGAGNEAIREQPLAADCNWSDKSFGLLRDAIQRANDQAASEPGVPRAVSGAKPAR